MSRLAMVEVDEQIIIDYRNSLTRGPNYNPDIFETERKRATEALAIEVLATWSDCGREHNETSNIGQSD